MTGSADRTIKVWDLASGQLRLTLTGHIEQVGRLTPPFVLSYQVQCMQQPGSRHVWSMKSCGWGHVVMRVLSPVSRITCCIYECCLQDFQNITQYADMNAGELVTAVQGFASPVACFGAQVTGLAVSPRHPYLFSCGLDKQVKCWDLEYNKVPFHSLLH